MHNFLHEVFPGIFQVIISNGMVITMTVTLFIAGRGSEPKNYQCSAEGQKLHENSAPALAIISGNSLAFSRKIITSTVFYRHCAANASAPVVVNKSVSQKNAKF